MSVFRGMLFDNLGLKFTALLLALLVYLNVYTDRPTTMLVSFPIEYAELDDSLSLSGPAPSVVQAELRGTGKQLILMRVKEPRMKLSLAGARRGRLDRALAPSDLPLPAEGGITVENLVGPRVVTLDIDRKAHREVRVTARVTGQPAPGYHWAGVALVDPTRVRVTGPEQVILGLDSLVLAPVHVEGKRDTLSALVAPERLPDWCTAEPPVVMVRLMLAKGGH
jgi:YbbR domain-containing protein